MHSAPTPVSHMVNHKETSPSCCAWSWTLSSCCVAASVEACTRSSSTSSCRFRLLQRLVHNNGCLEKPKINMQHRRIEENKQWLQNMSACMHNSLMKAHLTSFAPYLFSTVISQETSPHTYYLMLSKSQSCL